MGTHLPENAKDLGNGTPAEKEKELKISPFKNLLKEVNYKLQYKKAKQ